MTEPDNDLSAELEPNSGQQHRAELLRQFAELHPELERATQLEDRWSLVCMECARVFDLTDSTDAEEWTHGHDCEA